MRLVDEVWNRAALHRGGWQPRAGDAALAALLLAHGLAMNGGVLHAAECLGPDELRAACDGYRFFQYDDVAKLLSDVAVEIAQGRQSGDLERNADSAYARSIPDDRALFSRFEWHLERRPESFAPVRAE